MKINLNFRRALALALVAIAALLLILSLEAAKPSSNGGPLLALRKLSFVRAPSAKNKAVWVGGDVNTNIPQPVNLPTFGHPIIAGIGGTRSGEGRVGEEGRYSWLPCH